MNEIVEQTKSMAHDCKVLYVEDHHRFAENIIELLRKLCPNVLYAGDGDAAYALYREHRPDIVLSDVKMPGMDGFELARKVKSHNRDVRVIFLTAFDEKENLYEAIEIGACRYLSKPTKVPVLVGALHDAVASIHNQRNERLFENQIKDIFNYQNNLLMMLEGEEPLLVNRQFLEFFGSESLDGFMRDYGGIDALLLEHQGFLYPTPEEGWYAKASGSPGKLFHAKILNHEGEVRHLILKLRHVPGKEGYAILSFDDITDLNLLAIFDSKASKNDQILQERSAVLKLMKVVRDNSAEVKLHNFYKGLTIVNGAVLTRIEENEVVLKTTYSQLKAIKASNHFTITSEVFPYSVWCKTIKAIDFDAQSVTFSDVKFIEGGADKRGDIRLEPDGMRQSATLFYQDVKFYGKTSIVDISIRSVKLEIDALPAGLAAGEAVKIALVIETDRQPLNFSVGATVHRIESFSKCYHLILLFELPPPQHDKLTDYLAKRQLELIREFKTL